MSGKSASPTEAKTGDALAHTTATTPRPAMDDDPDNSASTLIESPVKPGDGSKKHDFPEGGGSGGAEAYRIGKRPVPPAGVLGAGEDKAKAPKRRAKLRPPEWLE
ncbi:MAG: hypothetical protein V4625_00935 [Pseudomonadota bacterium]